ncbi:cytochrome P450 4A25-like [Physella acuta]|uniref:cytochrome P450 4A25-like n=1 Tax=Physella acuta TaxID=109671 RepID=UPI0027DAC64C|nr:cytochrome P450 4A25-like [Physella acuta]
MATITNYLVGAVFLVSMVVVAVKAITAMFSYKRRRDLLMRFPQDPAHPLFGHLLDYPGPDEKGLAYQRMQTGKYPRTNLAWMLHTPMVMVTHPDTVKVVLKSSEPKGKRIYNLIRPWVGDGLLTSSGEKWARNRRLLTPAFHFEILKNYIELKNRSADLLLLKFQQAAEKAQPFKVFVNITMFTLDVILKCAMSYETGCQNQGQQHPYVQAVNALSEMMVNRFFRPWLHSDLLFFLTPEGRKFKKHCNYVHKVAEDIIKQRKEKLRTESPVNANKERHHRCMDFLDILLTAHDETGQGLTNAEIRDEVDTFLFEGHDTTASAISWALYSIAEHDEVQQQICEEIDGLMASKTSTDILWEDLSQLPYLTMVIKESLRLHSPVPFIQRELTVDTEIDGKMTPAGTMVNIVIYNAHHNPTIWDDSMKFDPNRFLPENSERRSAYAFVPFSAGPRNCIGQNFAMDEIKIALARILYRFNIRLDPSHKVEKQESIVMRAKDDIHLLVTERHNA